MFSYGTMERDKSLELCKYWVAAGVCFEISVDEANYFFFQQKGVYGNLAKV